MITLPIIISALIVVAAIVIGIKDVGRFSLYRARAVASVCFRESIRRRILLIIPLAILGVLAVSAFTKPVDEQDALRQILKFSLFASGLLMVTTLIILACTNLPREIDNRVIYTIVTKPTTRLEIIIGKIMGFAGIAAVVLAIMGGFTLAYLGLNAYGYHRSIASRLASGEVTKAERATLENYETFGLLTAKKLARSQAVTISTSLPEPGDKTRWFGDASHGDIVVPFEGNNGLIELVASAADNDPNPPRLVISAQLKTRPARGYVPSTQPNAVQPAENVQMSLLTARGELVVDAAAMGGVNLPIAEDGQVFAVVPKQYVPLLRDQRRFHVQVAGESPAIEYGLDPYSVQIAAITGDGRYDTLKPFADPMDPTRQLVIFRGKQGRAGQQVEGTTNNYGATALYQFRGVDFSGSDPNVSVEVKVGIEKSGDEDSAEDVLSELELTFINRSAGANGATATVVGYPETNRPLFLTVPRTAVAGGDFDVIYKSKTPGHYISADMSSLVVVKSREPFFWNLIQSLLVLWMMSLLVIIVSVFTSTFLSWPIAVVLTLIILCSRWLLEQLGDALDSSIGNQMVTQMGVNDPSLSRVMSKSVTGLTTAFKTLGSILPDISAFSAMEHIEQGLAVPTFVMAQSSITLALFGLPMLALAYVFLRYKEVAP